MPRTITTSHASSATSRERARKPPSIRPTIRVTGANAHSCPRADNARPRRSARPRADTARSRRSACPPPVEPITATRMFTLLIDNYDSYTFNLFHLIGEVNGDEPVVVRNDELSWEELARFGFDNVVISPGPGRPERPRDAGVSLEVLRRADVPVLGVCLGHQELAYAAGGTIEHAPEVMHGRLSPIRHDAGGLVAGPPRAFLAGGSRSLVGAAVPPELRVTA